MSAGVIASAVEDAVTMPNPIIITSHYESTHYASYGVWGVWDKQTGTIWCSNAATGWVEYGINTARAITEFYLLGCGCRNWTLQGSNDRSAYTTITTGTDRVDGFSKETFANSTAYLYYRLHSNTHWASCGGAPVLTEWSFDPIKTAFSSAGNFPGWEAFDAVTDQNSIQGWAQTAAGAQSVTVEMFQNEVFTMYGIATNIDAWQLHGSTDNTNWTLLDTRSGQPDLSATPPAIGKAFAFANSTAYLYYRFQFTPPGSSGKQITKIRFA